jgi:hypothetical protein
MKCSGLLLTALGFVVLTGLVLYAAGWFSRPAADEGGLEKARRRALDAAALQYRQYQPRRGSSLHCLLRLD